MVSLLWQLELEPLTRTQILGCVTILGAVLERAVPCKAQVREKGFRIPRAIRKPQRTRAYMAGSFIPLKPEALNP